MNNVVEVSYVQFHNMFSSTCFKKITGLIRVLYDLFHSNFFSISITSLQTDKGGFYENSCNLC